MSKNDLDTVEVGLAPALRDDALKSMVRITKPGEIARKKWLEDPERHENVFIDEYVIMSDHLYAIVSLSVDSSRATARVAPTLGQNVGSYRSKCVIEYLIYIDPNVAYNDVLRAHEIS